MAIGGAARDVQGRVRSLAGGVYDALRADILALRIEPGTALDKRALCERFGTSRSPVNEAVQRLALDGLVDLIPQSGSYVSRLSVAAIAEAVFLREAIEVAAAIHVAEAADPEVLRALRRNVAMQEMLAADGDPLGLYDMDKQLHATILASTGHPSILRVAADVGLRIERARRLVLPTAEGPRGVVEEHRAMVDAIVGRDQAVIRDTMAAHLRKLNERVRPAAAKHPHYFVPSPERAR